MAKASGSRNEEMGGQRDMIRLDSRVTVRSIEDHTKTLKAPKAPKRTNLLKRWKRLSRDKRNTIIDGILLVTLGFTTYAIVYYGMIIGVALWPAK